MAAANFLLFEAQKNDDNQTDQDNMMTTHRMKKKVTCQSTQ